LQAYQTNSEQQQVLAHSGHTGILREPGRKDKGRGNQSEVMTGESLARRSRYAESCSVSASDIW
jgi:hypothetical protein